MEEQELRAGLESNPKEPLTLPGPIFLDTKGEITPAPNNQI